MKNKYALIGSGRLATHWAQYFKLLNIGFSQYSRCGNPQSNTFSDLPSCSDRLEKTVSDSNTILLLISDDQIIPFINEHLSLLQSRRLVHMSGTLVTSLAEGVHPLMSFTNSGSYPLNTYSIMPLIYSDELSRQTLFTELPNPKYVLDDSLKPLYHAYCVVAGNFSTLLWQSAALGFTKNLGLPPDLLNLYIEQIFNNFKHDAANCLTGPIARGDLITQSKNIEALAAHPPLNHIYQLFNELFDTHKKHFNKLNHAGGLANEPL